MTIYRLGKKKLVLDACNVKQRVQGVQTPGCLDTSRCCAQLLHSVQHKYPNTMTSPAKIGSLFAKLTEQKDGTCDEPDWLATEEPEEPGRRQSESSDDPFDVLMVSPALKRMDTVMREDDTTHPSDANTIKAGNGTSAPTAQSFPLAAVGEGEEELQKKVNAPINRSSTAVLRIPEKIAYQRLLVELPGDMGAAVDLSGDTGAVGRITCTDSTGKGLLLDLKGVVYKSSLALMPCTACAVNIGAADAKVEAFFNEFVQLDKSSLFQDAEVLEDGNIDDWLATENYDVGMGEGGMTKTKATGNKRKDLGVASGKVVKAGAKKGRGAGKTKGAKRGKGKVKGK